MTKKSVDTDNIGLRFIFDFRKPVIFTHGDSVVGSTPVIIREDGYISIIPIEDLYGVESVRRGRVFLKNIEVWTEQGWSEIKYVYKHKSRYNKKGYRVHTDRGFVEVTEDHSLVVDGKKVSPNDLMVGDKIERYRPISNAVLNTPYDLAWVLGFFCADGTVGKYKKGKSKKYNQYSCRIGNTNKILLQKAQAILMNLGFEFEIIESRSSRYTNGVIYYLHAVKNIKKAYEYFSMCVSKTRREKIVPKIILNSSLNTKKAFLEGYMVGDGYVTQYDQLELGTVHHSLGDGLCLILEELGYDWYISVRDDKPNWIRIRTRKTAPQKRKPFEIITLQEIEIDDYVYDIETENHHFCGGIGGILLHNTDGMTAAALLIREFKKNGVKPLLYITQPFSLHSDLKHELKDLVKSNLIFVDLALTDKSMILIPAGSVVIDHHPSSEERISMLKEKGIHYLIDTSVSASMLCERIVSKSKFNKYLARLGGVGDWIIRDKRLGKQAMRIAAAISLEASDDIFRVYVVNEFVRGQRPHNMEGVNRRAEKAFKELDRIKETGKLIYEGNKFVIKLYKNGFGRASVLASKLVSSTKKVAIVLTLMKGNSKQYLMTGRSPEKKGKAVIDMRELTSKFMATNEGGGLAKAASCVIEKGKLKDLVRFVKKIDKKYKK